MPTNCIRIKDVMRIPRRSGLRFDVLEEQSERPGRIFVTWTKEVADLCEKARELDSAVAVQWYGSQHGERIHQVRILRTGEYAFERALQKDRV